jgi:hypothetical protein
MCLGSPKNPKIQMHEYVLLMHFNSRLFAKDDKLICLYQELT